MNEAEKAFEAWTVMPSVAGTFVVGLCGEWMKTAWLAACRWRAERDREIAVGWCRTHDEPRCSPIIDAIEKDAGL